MLAADGPAAEKLAPEISGLAGTQSSTWYFALPSPPPVADPILGELFYFPYASVVGLIYRPFSIYFEGAMLLSSFPFLGLGM